MSKTSYTATHPDTGEVFTRSTERATGYAFAVIVKSLREDDLKNGETRRWAEWAARRDLADKNAASWNSKHGKTRVAVRSTRGGYGGGYEVDYGAGYHAVVVPAVPTSR
jgi:hypothetical protein